MRGEIERETWHEKGEGRRWKLGSEDAGGEKYEWEGIGFTYYSFTPGVPIGFTICFTSGVPMVPRLEFGIRPRVYHRFGPSR